MASGAEVVRMLCVIPRCRARSGCTDDDHDDSDCQRNLDRSRSRYEPVDDDAAILDQQPDDRNANDHAEQHATDLNPRWDCREKESDYLPDAAGKRRLYRDRVEGLMHLLKCRGRAQGSADGFKLCDDHTWERDRGQLPRSGA